MPTSPQPALLLIDMQKESSYGIEGMDEAVAAAEGVLAACRTAGIPVVYTRHVNRRDGVGVSLGEVFDSEGLPVYYRGETDSIAIWVRLSRSRGTWSSTSTGGAGSTAPHST